MTQISIGQDPALLALLIILAVWDLIWKAFALWRAGHKNQLGWFLAILILNTVGILPIIYLLLTKNDGSKQTH